VAVRKAATATKRRMNMASTKSGDARSRISSSTTKRNTRAKANPTNGASTKKAAARTFGRRADLGAPTETFFARQPPEQRALLEALHALVERAAPDARASIKWGMPYFEM